MKLNWHNDEELQKLQKRSRQGVHIRRLKIQTRNG